MSDQERLQRAEGRRERQRRALKRKLAFYAFGICLLILLFFAPNLVGISPLRNSLVPRLLPNFKGQVSLGRISLGWLSPIVVSDVKVSDARGNQLLTVETFRTSKPLLALLTNQKALGEFTVVRPDLVIELREDGSNLEDVLSSLITEKDASTSMPQVSIKVQQGTVRLIDTVASRSLDYSDVSTELQLPGRDHTLEGIVTAVSKGGNTGQAGEMQAQFYLDTDPKATIPEKIELELSAQSFPIANIDLLLRRFTSVDSASGRLSGKIQATVEPADEKMLIDLRNVVVTDATLKSRALLGQDELFINGINAAGQVRTQGDLFSARTLSVQTDVGDLQLDGTFDWQRTFGNGVDFANLPNFKASGNIDLVRLSSMLPNTLRLKEDTSIQNGKLDFTAFSRLEGNQRRLFVDIHTDQLRATRNGQVFTLEQPIRISAAMLGGVTAPEIEYATIESSFLNVNGQGSLERGELTLAGDLQRLANQLEQFITLDQTSLSGQINGNLNWQLMEGATSNSDASSTIQLEANFDVASWRMVIANLIDWRDQKATFTARVQGTKQGNAVTQIGFAQVNFDSGPDSAAVRLLAPIDIRSQGVATSGWKVEANGDLTSWLGRIGMKNALPLKTLSAQFQLEGETRLNPELLQLAIASLQFQQLNVEGDGFRFVEPQSVSSFTVEWDRTRNLLAVNDLQIATSSISMATQQIRTSLDEPVASLSGRVAYRAHLGRVCQWLDATRPMSETLDGMLVGDATFANSPQGMTFNLASQFQNLTLAKTRASSPPGQTNAPLAKEILWAEDLVKLDGEISYQADRKTWNIRELKVMGSSVGLDARGYVADPGGRCEVDLAGQVHYDLDRLTQRLQPITGNGVKLNGQQSHAFALKGPLLSPGGSGPTSNQPTAVPVSVSSTSTTGSTANMMIPIALTGEGGLGWKSGNAYGIQFGAGSLDATLAQSRLHFKTLNMPLGQGKIQMTPRLDLNSTGPMLHMGREPIIQGVQITPDMCRLWLRYVAPILADVTQVQGNFSVDMQNAQVPILQPFAGRASAVVKIEKGTVGPGPLGVQLIWLANQVKSLASGNPLAMLDNKQQSQWIIMPAQNVTAQLANSRVYHDRMTFLIGDVSVQTSGSVGSDQSLDLMATVPIKKEWVKDQRFLDAIGGSTLQIPIRGSLNKPQINARALENLSKQMIQNAAGRVIEDELRRGIDKIFGGSR